MQENIVQEIMGEFADRTGLLAEGAAPVRRYLWTDAFAVCNYLALYEQSGREEHLHLALGLVDQVHEILGRHRDNDPRSGWISGLEEGAGRLHPVAGGLRIGKKLPERQEWEPFDERLEWERDGQYYHYLTKWMHALCCASRAIDNPVYTAWAAELAGRAHGAFCHTGVDGAKGLYWKMSIDLSRPLVASMGQHDPLDGLITCMEISAYKAGQPEIDPRDLAAEIMDLADMCRSVNWTTPDPLGLGGLLADAWRLVQLQCAKAQLPLPGLVQTMLEGAVVGLSIFTRDNSLHLPAAHRLAFRELGLSIGLQAIARIEALFSSRQDLFSNESRLDSLLEALRNYLPLQEQIEQFWLEPGNNETPSWKEHADINMVMLATSLAPEGYLDLLVKSKNEE
jgi:hypothetical protein